MNDKKRESHAGLIAGLCIIITILVICLGGVLVYLLMKPEETGVDTVKEMQSEEILEPDTENEENQRTGIKSKDETSITYENGDVVYCPKMESLAYDEESAVVYYENLLMVYLMSDLDEESADALAQSVGGTVAGKISGAVNALQISVDASDLDEIQAYADKLMESEEVLYASYYYPMELEPGTISDQNPWSGDGNIIENKGCEDTPDGNDWWAEATGAYTAWELAEKQNLRKVKVGILDTGFEFQHGDLSENLSPIQGYEENVVNDHGTHVAGLIGAGNNDIGIRGIADTASLSGISYYAWNSINSGEYLEMFKQMIENDVRVINNSWGYHFPSEEGYTKSLFWDATGRFHEITDNVIRLKYSSSKNGYDKEYVFAENDVGHVKFYVNDNEVTYKKWRKKVRNGSMIGITQEEEAVTEVYLITNMKMYLNAVRSAKAYEAHVSYIQAFSQRTALEGVIMIMQCLMSGQENFMIVQSAGNGYDNGGPGVDAGWNCYFTSVDESIYNKLNPSVREDLEQRGITYQDIDDHIMIVGAVENTRNADGNYLMTSFSNYGDHVDICAPGQDVFSTVSDASGSYANNSGTSMSAPIVSGALALLWQMDPDLSASKIKTLLKQEISAYAIGVGDDAGTRYPMLNIGKAAKALRKGKESGSNKENDSSRDIVLVLDHSGSMDGNPLAQTKEAAEKFVDTVFEKDSRVAVVTYDSAAVVNSELTEDQQELQEDIQEIYAGSSTNMYAGLEQADYLLQGSQADRKIIVLMSDGLPNEGACDSNGYSGPLLQYAEEMKNRGYYIYTLGFFSSVGYDLYDAQQLMEGIASPGLHYEVNSAEDLVFFFGDIADQISGTKYVYIRIACPVDVTVESGDEVLSSKVDLENTRTSFGALTYENIQDEEGDVSADRVKVLRLNMDKDYDVEIEGYDSGSMDYTVSFPNEQGEYDDVRTFPNISVTSSTKATSNTKSSDATYLKVDKDGDGKVDTTYKTEANGKMEEVKDHTIVYIILIAAAVVLILIIILIAVLVHASGKKKKNQQGGMQNPGTSGYIYGAFGIFKDRSYPLYPGQQCTVGRKSTCDIQLLHSEVSRLHCVIEMLPEGIYQVTDYSSNGTFYNNQRLRKGEPYRLPKGAILAVGDADNILELK